MIRGNVVSLVKLLTALEIAGVELIADNAISDGGGRGVRLKAATELQRDKTTKTTSSISTRAA